MAECIVPNTAPFGALSNQAVAELISAADKFSRLKAAVANAASGYGGTAGTEYESGTNFGVVPSGTPGEKGADFAYALNVLADNMAAFMAANAGQIALLDNGVQA